MKIRLTFTYKMKNPVMHERVVWLETLSPVNNRQDLLSDKSRDYFRDESTFLLIAARSQCLLWK